MLQNSISLQRLTLLTQEFPAAKLDILAELIDQIYIADTINRQEFGSLILRIEQRKAGEIDVTQKLHQIAADIKEILNSQSWQVVIDSEDSHPDLPSDLADALYHVRECQWKYSESVGVPYED